MDVTLQKYSLYDLPSQLRVDALVHDTPIQKTENVENRVGRETRVPHLKPGQASLEMGIIAPTAIGVDFGTSAGFGLGLAYKASRSLRMDVGSVTTARTVTCPPAARDCLDSWRCGMTSRSVHPLGSCVGRTASPVCSSAGTSDGCAPMRR